MPNGQRPVNLTIDWSDATDKPVMGCNVFAIQQTPHEFVITLGYASMPIFPTDPTPEQIAELKQIPAKVISRISLSPGRMVELMQVVQQALKQFQDAQKQ
jgi:hypothetical protein